MSDRQFTGAARRKVRQAGEVPGKKKRRPESAACSLGTSKLMAYMYCLRYQSFTSSPVVSHTSLWLAMYSNARLRCLNLLG